MRNSLWPLSTVRLGKKQQGLCSRQECQGTLCIHNQAYLGRLCYAMNHAHGWQEVITYDLSAAVHVYACRLRTGHMNVGRLPSVHVLLPLMVVRSRCRWIGASGRLPPQHQMRQHMGAQQRRWGGAEDIGILSSTSEARCGYTTVPEQQHCLTVAATGSASKHASTLKSDGPFIQEYKLFHQQLCLDQDTFFPQIAALLYEQLDKAQERNVGYQALERAKQQAVGSFHVRA